MCFAIPSFPSLVLRPRLAPSCSYVQDSRFCNSLLSFSLAVLRAGITVQSEARGPYCAGCVHAPLAIVFLLPVLRLALLHAASRCYLKVTD